MIALILSICMAPVNAQGQTIGFETCEENHISVHYTMPQCLARMDKEQVKIMLSPLAPFDWMLSCEIENDRNPTE